MAEKKEQHASKSSEQAMRENDAHTRKSNSHDAVPGDDTAHAHSHAAHENVTDKAHTNNEAGGSKTGEVQQPHADQLRRHDEPQRKVLGR